MDLTRGQFNEELKWSNIENRWIKYWEENKINISDPNINKDKYFITVAYPYPNSPQHIGHGRTYTIADVHARYNRLRGKNVLFPMGFHYTGSPILGMSRRVRDKDYEIINNFKNIFGIDEDIIMTFVDPINIANYFHHEIKNGMKEMGYSIDWRREFTTVDPLYKKFITWQFRRLKNLGLIEQGSHPVGWCPVDKNPVSQHDTLGDIEPSFTEYSLIKFKFENDEIYIPVATLRPETIYGVTNLWINDKNEYVKVLINNTEQWIISEPAAIKLEYLNYKIKRLQVIQGKDLVGKKVKTPLTEDIISIFPANFVRMDDGSGIVMSVPAHAPYDMQALLDLNKNQIHVFENFGIEQILPKIIITSKINQKPIDYSKLTDEITRMKRVSYNNNIMNSDLKRIFKDLIPSVFYLNKYSISDQNDPNLELATSELYSSEFYDGIMNDNSGRFSGLRVSEAKDLVKNDLAEKNNNVIFYELTNKPVYCRCGSLCYVKLLENQWFLNYGNPKWKKNANDCLNQMEVIPNEIIEEFRNTFEWLRERACARKSGMGTLLPWDNEWVIESLSDSVIYMIYYLISKYVNTENLLYYEEYIDDDFFDFILFNKKDGIFYHLNDTNNLQLDNHNSIKNKSRQEAKLKEFLNLSVKIRQEYLYFYPLDSRHSGRDLIPNHLSFFIFNHSIIFPKEMWPKQIVVNGSVLMDGKKMSKSMGNIIPLRNTIKQYSADSIRVAMIALGELLQDVDFSFSALKSIYSKLNEFHEKTLQFLQENKNLLNNITDENILIQKLNDLSLEEKWLIHKLNLEVSKITTYFEELKFRDALNLSFYLLDKDLEWYKKRRIAKENSTTNTHVFVEYYFIICRIKILSPFCPFMAEELWSVINNNKMNKDKSIFLSSWPIIHPELLDPVSAENEILIQELLVDLNKILKVTKNVNPKKIIFYLADTNKKIVYSKVLELILKTKDKNFGNIMKMLLNDISFNNDQINFIKRNSQFVKKSVDDILSLSPEDRIRRQKLIFFDESVPINDSISLLSSEFNVPTERIELFSEDDPLIIDPKKRAPFSRPFKPAVYIE